MKIASVADVKARLSAYLFQALLDKSRRQIEETGGIPHEQFWREVEAESREDARKGKPGGRRSRRRT